jgi:hypothetical protein
MRLNGAKPASAFSASPQGAVRDGRRRKSAQELPPSHRSLLRAAVRVSRQGPTSLDLFCGAGGRLAHRVALCRAAIWRRHQSKSHGLCRLTLQPHQKVELRHDPAAGNLDRVRRLVGPVRTASRGLRRGAQAPAVEVPIDVVWFEIGLSFLRCAVTPPPWARAHRCRSRHR